jgi:quercetin dioxygenase-like cupin family protein
MLKSRTIKFNELSVTIYDFEVAGDDLPDHAHEPGSTHITICAKGEVDVITPEWTKTLKEGNIIEFYPKQIHSIVARTDNSRIVNVPTFYARS